MPVRAGIVWVDYGVNQSTRKSILFFLYHQIGGGFIGWRVVWHLSGLGCLKGKSHAVLEVGFEVESVVAGGIRHAAAHGQLAIPMLIPRSANAIHGH